MTISENNVRFYFKAQGPVGTYGFSVTVASKGLARMTPTTTFTFQLTATTINPATAGTGGFQTFF